MKLLAIRGKNLASIAGEFEIDFTIEPLRSAGIFAICGATGAGKSTILDAVCLALFNNTPRMTGCENIKMTDVGREQILQGDKRQILRRGTTDGYAEVDFRAINGRMYRSNWHVRRANNKISGKLQAIELRVYDLDSQREITSKISDSESKLRELTGLTYEQFTRTVLLAQNEFARFLKARKDEKAEVLEKLTGTEIYSVISNKIYTKNQAVKSAWQQLSERLSGIRLLSDEEVDTLNERQNRFIQEEKVCQQTHAQTLYKIKWLEQYESFVQDSEKAIAEFQQAQQAVEIARPQAEWLRQIENTKGAAVFYRNKQKCAADLKNQQNHCQETTEQLLAIGKIVKQAREEYGKYKEILSLCINEYDTLKPILLKARETDIEIKNAQINRTESEKNREEASQKRTNQETRLTEKGKKLEDLRQQSATLENWFQKNRKYEQMCLNIELITGFLDTANHCTQQTRQEEEKLQQIGIQQATGLSGQKKMFDSLQTVNNELTEKTNDRKQLQGQLDQINIKRIRNSQKELQEQKTILQQASHYLQALLKIRQEVTRQQSDHEELQKKHSTLLTLSVQTSEESKTAQIQRDTSQKLYEKAQLAANKNIAFLRQQLQPGIPCPVCGSCEHPATQHPASVAPTLHLLKSEYEKYDTVYRLANENSIRLAQDILHSQEDIRHLEKEIISMQKQCEEMEAEWNVFYSHHVKHMQISTWEQCSQQISDSNEQLKSLDLQEETYNQQANRLQKINQEIEQLTSRQTQLNQQLDKSKDELNNLSSSILKGNAICAQLKQQAEEALCKISEKIPVDNWHKRWESDGEQFRQELTDAAVKWQAKQQESETVKNAILQLQIEQTEGLRTLETLRGNEKETTTTLEKHTETLTRLQMERANLLNGKSVDETEQVYQQKIQKITVELNEADTEKNRITGTYNSLEGEINQLVIAIGTLKAQYRDYQQQLDQWLEEYNSSASFPLNENTLAGLLETQPEQITATRDKLNCLYNQLAAAEATSKERTARINQHLQDLQKPDIDTEDTEQLNIILRSLQERIEVLKHDITEISIELRTHSDNCRQAGTLRQELEQQTRIMEQWGKLDDLVGSQSGYKFKEIAQGFTLDILLRYANRQLKELSPRYRLQRIPDELAIQIIDHDMCDEIRSVFSLSGGESFLISLSLALGLSSFSSQNHHEENLFIDEGFGTLDAETLQIVMETLERLRSQGRKVGIISHVREMAERIPVQICVNKTGNGKSRIKIVG